MEKEQQRLTVEQLSALYWLKVLDDYKENPQLQTLGEKFDNFEVEPQDDEAAEKRENLNIAVKELAEKGYVTGVDEDGGFLGLSFTAKGLEIANKLENDAGFEKVRKQIDRERNLDKIKEVLYNNRGLIINVLGDAVVAIANRIK